MTPDVPFVADPMNPTDAELSAAIQRGLANGTLIDAAHWLAREDTGPWASTEPDVDDLTAWADAAAECDTLAAIPAQIADLRATAENDHYYHAPARDEHERAVYDHIEEVDARIAEADLGHDYEGRECQVGTPEYEATLAEYLEWTNSPAVEPEAEL